MEIKTKILLDALKNCTDIIKIEYVNDCLYITSDTNNYTVIKQLEVTDNINQDNFKISISINKNIKLFDTEFIGIDYIENKSIRFYSDDISFLYPAVVNTTISINSYRHIINNLSVESHELITAINKVRFCSAKRDNKRYLNSILLDYNHTTKSFKIVATDGIRLAVTDININHLFTTDTQLLIPIESIKNILELKGTVIIRAYTDNIIKFSSDTVCIITQKEGQFPAYNNILNNLSKTNKLVVDKRKLLRVLSKNKEVIKCHVTDNILLINDSIKIDCINNNEFTFSVNSSYLREHIQHAKDDIIILYQDGLKLFTTDIIVTMCTTD